MNDIILSTQNGEPVASSRDVAERFGKEHKDVLRSIKNLTAQNCALLKMFHKTEYTTAQNKKATMYLMNRDGFSLLAMGFTGKEAVQWKLRYIEAFNQMEKQLAEQNRTALEKRDENLQGAIQNVSYVQQQLNKARRDHKLYVDARQSAKIALANIRAMYASACEQERRAAQYERDWQDALDQSINNLKAAAGDRPTFDEILNETLCGLLLPAKKEE